MKYYMTSLYDGVKQAYAYCFPIGGFVIFLCGLLCFFITLWIDIYVETTSGKGNQQAGADKYGKNQFFHFCLISLQM